MDYKEFFDIASEFGLTYPSPPRYGATLQARRLMEKESYKPENAMFKETWRTGGTGGGSCWDDGEHDHHYSITGDPEPPMEALDKFLMKVCPNISFLVYKNMENSLLERDTSSEFEYYGNDTQYGHKFVKLKALYEYLKENKQI